MGLDLTVNLHSSTNNAETVSAALKNFIALEASEFANQEDFSFSDGAISKYYLLNWSGVGIERNFSYGILGFLSNVKAQREQCKITINQLRKLKSNSTILVRGTRKTRWGIESFEKLLIARSIVKGKGNTVKIKHILKDSKGQINDRFHKPTYISKYSLYNLDALPFNKRFYSVLQVISMGQWGGGNGEEYTLKHNLEAGGLDVYTSEYQDPEVDERTERLVSSITAEDFARLIVYAELNIEALEKLMISDPEDQEGWAYIASNNLMLLKMFQVFADHKDLELVSYFG